MCYAASCAKFFFPKIDLLLKGRSFVHTRRLLTPGFLVLFLVSSTAAQHAALHSAVMPTPQDKSSWLERHETINARIEQGQANLLWIGDSIIEGWEDSGKSVWDHYYAHRQAVNLGISGDRTEHVLWRLDHGNIKDIAPALAIVMIGQNNGPHNSAEEIAEGITAIVERLRSNLPDAKILLLGVFYRGEKPDNEWEKLSAVNRTIAALADNAHVFYRDVNYCFHREDGTINPRLMPDYEHPGEEGYALWAQAMEGIISRLLGDNAIDGASPYLR